MDSLGLSPDEYAWYISEVANIRPARGEAYAAVPDIECIPIVPIVMAVVGAGLSAASAALAPKPKPPKQQDPGNSTPENLESASVRNDRRYTNVDGFTSVQNVARLGDVCPLVFAKREKLGGAWYGGVRAETKMLWSQLLSQGDGQELVALFALNAMVMAQPDQEGLAIGDALLKNYQAPKLCAYYRSGEVTQRISSTNKIGGQLEPRSPSDLIVAEYDNAGMQPIFSGTRTPTSGTQFGVYQPVRNGQDWRLPLKRVKVYFDYKNISNDQQMAFALAELERAKVESFYGSFCGILQIDQTTWPGVHKQFQVLGKDHIVHYFILADLSERNFAQHGASDILNKRRSIGEQADEAFVIGETYLVGTAQAVCVSTSSRESYDARFTKAYQFKITEPGTVLALGPARAQHHGTFRILYGCPTTDLTIVKLAIGSITTTRAVDQVEVGIKSTVYKKFNGITNFAGIMPEHFAEQAEAGGGTVNYGTYTDYAFRYSFFYLEYRKSSSEEWTRVAAQPFGVKGHMPVTQYNFVRLTFLEGQDIYEVRFLPLSGNEFIAAHQRARLLDAGSGGAQTFVSDDRRVRVSYVGTPLEAIDWFRGTNRVMFWGGAPDGVKPFKNAVTAMAPDQLVAAILPAEGVYNTSGGGGSGLKIRVTHEPVVDSFVVTSITTGWRQRWLHMAVLGLDPPTSAGMRTSGRLTLVSAAGSAVFIDIPLYSVAVADPIYNSDMNTADWGAFTYGWISDYQVNESIQIAGYAPVDGGGVFDGEEFFVDKPPWWNVYTPVTRVGVRFNVQARTITRLTIEAGGENYNYRETFTVDGTSLPPIMISGLASGDGIPGGLAPVNTWDAVSDVYLFGEEEGSHDDSPEHEIVYVNEQRRNAILPLYQSLALVGMQLRSGKDWSSFNNFSFYAKTGRVIPLMIDDAGNAINRPDYLAITGPSHLFPEILRNLLRSTIYGTGALVPESMIDWDGFRNAARACQANRWFFDGVLSAQTNPREWAYQHAGFFLLDFVIKGGRISLSPAFPVDPTSTNGYAIDYARKPVISALFTDGNIIEDSLEVNWYSTEQRTVPQVVVNYRHESENDFAETRSVLVRLKTTPETAPTEAVDFTGFCTSIDHAKTYAKFLIQARGNSTHTIQFKTLPDAVGLEPGAYFKLSSVLRHATPRENGYVLDNGKVVTSTDLSGQTVSVHWWRSGMAEIGTGTMAVDANGEVADGTFRGAVFTVFDPADYTSARVYRAESISYDEDGLLDIGASHVHVDEQGRIAALNLDENLFVVEVQT